MAARAGLVYQKASKIRLLICRPPPQVPTAHGKADLGLYRSEGRRVLQVLGRLATAERASIDE